MRFYKLKSFTRFQRRERITDHALERAVRDAEKGLIDADLGGGLIKQRVARPGQGKRSGFRTIIAFRRGSRAVFLFGFAKNERENIDDEELYYFQKIGRFYLGLDEENLEDAITSDELVEVRFDEKE